MPFDLWPDPRDGLDPDDSPWTWVENNRTYDRPTDHPPNGLPGWQRWYFLYDIPGDGQRRISADRDPQTGEWFNPHPSSIQP